MALNLCGKNCNCFKPIDPSFYKESATALSSEPITELMEEDHLDYSVRAVDYYYGGSNGDMA